MSGEFKNSPASGLLNLNKPPAMTSRRVVDRVVGLVRGLKVGHAGTLDPLATGVLMVCVGSATRLIEYVQRMPKTYRTVIRLGARSDTLDADGRITEVVQPRVAAHAEVEAALRAQVGTIAQRPPEFSALRLGGRRAYDLARAGKEVALEPRPVTIYRIELIRYAWPHLELEIVCGGGTYIRSIARDVGDELGCGGLVEVLTRTRIGPFTIEEATDLGALGPATFARALRPALEAVAELPRVELSAGQLAEIVQGRELPWDAVSQGTLPPGEIALIGPDGGLAAIGEHAPAAGRIRPRRVLVPP